MKKKKNQDSNLKNSSKNGSQPTSTPLAPTGSSLGNFDPVSAYMQQIKKYPLLTKEEEKELAIDYYENKNPLAAERLVTSNLRFVVKIAGEYSKFGAKLIDLIQEGNVGLMHAVKDFNPYKGTKLITYAVWWIRGYIKEYLMKQKSLVKMGTTQAQKKLYYNLNKERQKLLSEGLEPSVKLLSTRLGVEEKDVVIMSERLDNPDISLDQPLDDSSQATLMNLQTSDLDEQTDSLLAQHQEVALLNEHIEKLRPHLKEKEIKILNERVLSEDPKSLQEIGTEWGVSREAVRQMEARLIKKIKNSLKEELQDREPN